jgi:hypothetical protein
VVTNEQVDSGALQTTLNTVLQIVGGNPAVLQNPSTRTMIFKSLELAGISPVELKLLNEQIQANPQEMMPQGGSISAPGSPMPMQTQNTVMAK